MPVVLIHLGKHVPPHMPVALEQFRIWNRDSTLHLILDDDAVEEFRPLISKYKINWYPTSMLSIVYEDGCIGYPQRDFWNVSLKRLYYLHDYIIRHKLYDVVHFENDIMIYSDIKNLIPDFSILSENLAITVGTPWHCMTGMMYIKEQEHLGRMLRYFRHCFDFGNQGFMTKFGADMVNEMTLMGAFRKEHPDLIRELPSLPFGEHSHGLPLFGSLFDPAAWGQYLGGTPHNGRKPGWKENLHYIGQELIAGRVEAKFEGDAPYVYDLINNKRYRLNNLHVHSKNLEQFMSK